ncbi:hypothetical protein [Nocardia sp. NPDC056000]|uniref:hypothetical protein n=1 Tax=Nocardia sp. NPDC056000 TaxID=3345674 RepID=UPI0035D81E6A
MLPMGKGRLKTIEANVMKGTRAAQGPHPGRIGGDPIPADQRPERRANSQPRNR